MTISRRRKTRLLNSVLERDGATVRFMSFDGVPHDRGPNALSGSMHGSASGHGLGLGLDGIAMHAKVQDASGAMDPPSDVSIQIGCRIDNIGTTAVDLCEYGNATNGFRISADNLTTAPRVLGRINTPAGQFGAGTTNSAISLGSFFLFTITQSSSSNDCYIDGVDVTNGIAVGQNATATDPTFLYIGRGAVDSGARYTPGLIEYIAVFPGVVLTPSQILDHVRVSGL